MLILDEPTAVLTPEETEELFEVLRRLAGGGRTIIFISHKLNEVLSIADRITILRGGKHMAAIPGANATIDRLAHRRISRISYLRTVVEVRTVACRRHTRPARLSCQTSSDAPRGARGCGDPQAKRGKSYPMVRRPSGAEDAPQLRVDRKREPEAGRTFGPAC